MMLYFLNFTLFGNYELLFLLWQDGWPAGNYKLSGIKDGWCKVL